MLRLQCIISNDLLSARASQSSMCSALRAFEERRLAEGPKEEFRFPWLSLQCNGNIHVLCDGDSNKMHPVAL